MLERMYIGGCPADEPCVQIRNGASYLPAATFEAQLYLKLLQETYPPPEGGKFQLISIKHIFGDYTKVVAVYNSEDEKAVEWAHNVRFGVDKWPETYKNQLAANPTWAAALHKG